jgi:mono/diheme cytochrome c family protein
MREIASTGNEQHRGNRMRRAILMAFVFAAGAGVAAAQHWPLWPMEPGISDLDYGSMPRHHFAMMSSLPDAYRSLVNPLLRTPATIERGAAIYAMHCASCHGVAGTGDGPAGRALSPRPGNLAWLAKMPMSRWDPFMYWTIAEGGAQFGTPMPAFKDTLATNDIWAAVTYIQARLPRGAR